MPNVGDKSRRFFSNLEDFAKENGAKGMATLIYEDSKVRGSVSKPLSDEIKEEIRVRMNAEAGCAVLFIGDERVAASSILG